MKNYLNKLILLIFCLLPLFTYSQEKKRDFELVKETIENYYYGYIHRDGDRLNKAFDTVNGTMKLPTESGFENGSFKEIIPKWASRDKMSKEMLAECSLDFLNVDVVEGKMGVVKIRMKIVEKIYLDMLSLQKIDNQWKITNKMFIEL